jgi:WD40 repeat protein
MHSVCLNCFEKSLLKCSICNRENFNFIPKKNYCLVNLIDNFSKKLIHNYSDNLTNHKNNKNEYCNINNNNINVNCENKGNLISNLIKIEKYENKLFELPKKNNLAAFLKKASEIDYSSLSESESEIEYEENPNNSEQEGGDENSEEAKNQEEYLNNNLIDINSNINNFDDDSIESSDIIEEESEEENAFLENENSSENNSSKNSILEFSRNLGREADSYFQSEVGNCVALYGHRANALCIETLSESLIASGGEDNLIKIWDIKKLICLKTLRGHTDKVLAITKINKFNPNNNKKNNKNNKNNKYDFSNLICSCSADSKIKFWDLNSGTCVKTFRSHENWVTSMLSFSDELFLSGDAEGKLIFWDLLRFKKLRKINAHANQWINSICKLNAFSFATCSGDCTIKLWDIANLECFKVLKHESNVWGIATLTEKLIMNNADNINSNISIGNNNNKYFNIVNNYNNNISKNQIENQMEEEIQFIISCSSDGNLKKWNLVDFSCENFEGDLNILKSISLLDKNSLISLGWDGHIKLWNIKEKRLIKRFNGIASQSDYFVNGISVINENTIATCDEDKCVKIWFNVSLIN